MEPTLQNQTKIFKMVWLVWVPEMEFYGTRDPDPPPGVGVGGSCEGMVEVPSHAQPS